MKSLWDKATEISSKAKSLATDYLGNQQINSNANNNNINEKDKIEGEKYLSLKNEIDLFKKESIKAAEEKIRNLNKKLETAIIEKDSLQKTNDEFILSLETSFCEKEKKYLIEISNKENEVEQIKQNSIKNSNIINELNLQIENCKKKFIKIL
jgi:hypothetical protein